MTSRIQMSLLTVANVLLPVAILTFAVGFFPYKPFIPGLASFRKLDSYGEPPAAPFDKVVFMVVDALRSDFVYSANSGFKFTQSLIASGSAIPFTAHATSPTITMPRVKAITTGSIPSFLDVILNFAESDTTSTLANQDTWLAQLAAKPGGKLVMYGDDTWLKLFPGFFGRADGTSSFFVSDFTEVDNNVTRHVPEELNQSDWNGMIMHYLGLDHIGHKTGPLGPNMIPKQIEMDGIVKQVYEAIESKPALKSTLLVLCGDHGMTDGGNHGGSAPGETSPALVFISPKMKQISKGLVAPTEPKTEFDYYTKVEQSDIAPTLAGLLGFPVPLNNLGVFISSFLEFWPRSIDRVQLLHRNALQILEIVQATFPGLDYQSAHESADCRDPSGTGQELACAWRKAVHLMKDSTEGAAQKDGDQAVAALIEPGILLGPFANRNKFCESAQSALRSTASNYDVKLLVIGLVTIVAALLMTLATLASSFRSPTQPGIFLTLLVILYGVMMFASSYVEEEQHFWYWTASGWFFCLYINSLSSQKRSFIINPYVVVLLLLRVARRYNQTGQKHAGAPDIVHSTFLTTPSTLWILIGLTYASLAISLKTDFMGKTPKAGSRMPDYSPSQLLGMSGAASIASLAFAFKMAFTSRDAPELLEGLVPGLEQWLEEIPLVALARMVFILLIAGAVWMIATMERKESDRGKRLSSGLFDVLTILLVTQTRSQNVPLFLVFRIMYYMLAKTPLSPVSITATTLLMSHVSFFALGNSNAISSIDLSNAYNGVSGYNVAMVGLLVFIGNWAGPIFWCVAGVRLLQLSTDNEQEKPGTDAPQANPSNPNPKAWIEREHKALGEGAKRISGASGTSAGASGEARAEHLLFHIKVLTAFTAASLLAVMAACTVLRTHLFIWTVFSPKYLYAMAWGTLWHLLVNIGLAWGIWSA